MFKKLQRQIDRKKSGAQSIKYRFDLQLASLDGLPKSVKECRVVWARGAKVQLSKIVEAKNGAAAFDQQLSQVATVYRDPRNQLEGKEYSIKIEVPNKGDTSKMLTLGKAIINMVRYINFENTDEEITVPVKLKVGTSATAYLKVISPAPRPATNAEAGTVRATMLRGYVADDGMTEVSGITGLSSLNEEITEQDLSGFDDDVQPEREEPRAPVPPAMSSIQEDNSEEPTPEVKPQPAKSEKKAAPSSSRVKTSAAVAAVADTAELKHKDQALHAAEEEIERLKQRLKKYKEAKTERDELVVKVKRLERAAEQAAEYQKELESTREEMARVNDAGGTEAVLRLAREALAAKADLVSVQRLADEAKIDLNKAHTAKKDTEAAMEKLRSQHARSAAEHEATAAELREELARVVQDREGADAKQQGDSSRLVAKLKATTAEVESLRDSQQQLEAELSACKTAHQAENLSAQEEVKELKAKLQQVGIAKRKADLEEERLKDQAQSLSSELGDLRDKLMQSSNGGADSRAVAAQLQCQLKDSQAVVQQQKRQLDSLAAELEELKIESDERVASGAVSQSALRAQLQASEREKEQTAKEMSLAKQQIARLLAALEAAEESAASGLPPDQAKQMEDSLEAANKKLKAMEKEKQELQDRIKGLEDELTQEQGTGEEVSQLREIYDSRISGLKRQLEEESGARAALEEDFQRRLQEEIQKAVDREAAKHKETKEKIRAEVKEMQIRAGEDLELLEARLLDIESEKAQLEKQKAESQRISNRTIQEKHALETQLLDSDEERSEMEREIQELRAQLSNGGQGGGGAEGLPVSTGVAHSDRSMESLADGHSGAADISNDEFMRVVTELTLAKISMAEMDAEKIRLKHDLYKQKEKYMTVAAKMTKLETRLYNS